MDDLTKATSGPSGGRDPHDMEFGMILATDPLIKVKDFGQLLRVGGGLPPHFQYLLTGVKGDQEFISVHELAARLIHVLLVETGFFPSKDDDGEGLERRWSPEDLVNMPTSVRIPEFGRKLSAKSMFSEQGVYALKYRVIYGKIDIIEEGPKDPAIEDVEIAGSSTDPDPEKEPPREVWNHYFSDDINVTIMILEDRLQITTVGKATDSGRSVTHQFILNIEEFFNQKPRVVPVRLRPEQWMRKFDINYARLSVYVKSKFCLHILDQVDGLCMEPRGLFGLPYLILSSILKKLDVVTVVRLSKTSTFFYNLVKDNRLWKFLLRRDFPIEFRLTLPTSTTTVVLPMSRNVGTGTQSTILPPPPTPAIVSTATSSTDPGGEGQKAKEEEKEPDYYTIYKEKYALKHRRLHRIHSLPLRFFPGIRIGRPRFDILPLPFPRIDRLF